MCFNLNVIYQYTVFLLLQYYTPVVEDNTILDFERFWFEKLFSTMIFILFIKK